MRNFSNFSTFHSHPQSLDSGSTPEAMLEREIELGTGTMTATDHGSMGACRKIYDLCRAKSITPILGIEAYFRDDNCPILKSFGIDDSKKYLKYYHVTLHALDQKAYEKLGKRLSNARVEKHGSESKPLFTWEDLEDIGSENVTIGSGCLVGMTQRHIVAHGRTDIALAYYQKLKSITKPGNFYTEIFPHVCSHDWVSGIFLEMADGTKLKFYAKKKLRLASGGEMEALELAKKFKTKAWKQGDTLVAVMNNRKWEDLPPVVINSAAHIEEFIQNECTPAAPNGDVQLESNRQVLEWAQRYGNPVIISDDSHYAHKDDKIVQDIRLQQIGNWRFYGNYARQNSEEAFDYFKTHLGTLEKDFESWVETNNTWASRFKDFKFDYQPSLPTKFYPTNTTEHLFELIRKHGRMDWSNDKYVERLKAEVALLNENGTLDLLSYFFVAEEVCSMYEEKGMLTGPGRGSSAGLLTAYLLGITHVDPLEYGLSMERFLTLDRIKSGKLPDIDFDFPTRVPLVGEDETKGKTGWLKERFGDHYAQLSVETTLKLKSSIKDVARVVHGGRVPDDIEALTKKMPVPPQGISDRDFVFGYKANEKQVPGAIETDPSLMEYVRKYPEEWKIVCKALGLSRQLGRHASAFVVANKPISDFIPLTKVSDITVTQYTAPSVEASGGIKLDFLVINSLADIQEAVKLVQERSGLSIPKNKDIDGKRVPGIRLLPHNGVFVDIWSLPEDQAVFHDVAEGKTETVFQFNTNSAVQWLRYFNHWKDERTNRKSIDSIEAMSAFTALDRPGPLDAYVKDKNGGQHNMLVEYARRARGEEPVGAVAPFMELFPETFGTLTYQEQLQRAYQQLTGCSGSEAEEFRVNVAKKKMDKALKAYPNWMERVGKKLGEPLAKEIWESFVTWGQYGFCKAHSTSYATIAYTCSFLKHHYPLEWWCAVLRNADKNEINEQFWKHCGHLIEVPDVSLSGDNFDIQGDKIRAPVSLLVGVGGVAHEQLCKYRPYKDIKGFTDSIKEHQLRGSTPIIDPATGRQAVDKKGKPKVKKGRNALQRKIVHKLIIAGTMDSLFPGTIERDGIHVPLTIFDKIDMYEKALADTMGTKLEAPPDYLNNLSQLMRYQMRKQVLPSFSAPLLQMVATCGHEKILDRDDGVPQWREDDKMTLPILSYQIFAALSELPINGGVAAALPAYVVAQRVFKYHNTKEACEFEMDVDGERLKFVKWPNLSGFLPERYKQDLVGAVVVVSLSKSRPDKPFALDSLSVVQEPLTLDSQEQSPEE